MNHTVHHYDSFRIFKLYIILLNPQEELVFWETATTIHANIHTINADDVDINGIAIWLPR